MRRALTRIIASGGAVLLMVGCDQPLPSPKQKALTPKAESTKLPLQSSYEQALSAYHTQGLEYLQKTRACVGNLRTVIPLFLQSPDDRGLAELYQMTRHCHRLYLPALSLTASYPALESRLTSLRRRIDSRPITPGFVDYVEGDPDSGIINDPTLILTRENLIAEQGLTDAADVVLGFEVILFLLEGEHRYKPLLPLRSAEDYREVPPGSTTAADDTTPPTNHPQNRRRQYLEIITDVLAQDLTLLTEAWSTFNLPVTQEEAQSLSFAIVRNWHSVMVSLSPEDAGEVTDYMLPLIASPSVDTSIAHLMKIDGLDGWPRDSTAVDPATLSQSLGLWLVQHNR